MGGKRMEFEPLSGDLMGTAAVPIVTPLLLRSVASVVALDIQHALAPKTPYIHILLSSIMDCSYEGVAVTCRHSIKRPMRPHPMLRARQRQALCSAIKLDLCQRLVASSMLVVVIVRQVPMVKHRLKIETKRPGLQLVVRCQNWLDRWPTTL